MKINKPNKFKIGDKVRYMFSDGIILKIEPNSIQVRFYSNLVWWINKDVIIKI